MSTAYRRRLPLLIIVSGFVVLCGITIQTNSAPTAQEPRVADDKPAGQVFKNIQVLKDVPASQLERAMGFMAASLGVSCDFCHTAAPESDEKSTKLTARQMITMTADINKQSFSGFGVVNCYTCHRGRTEPVSIPKLDESILPQADSGGPSLPLPTADVLVDRYETAIGGIAAIDKITTCVLIGSQTSYGPGRSPTRAPIEVYHKPPDKFLYYAGLPGGPVRQGFDGKTAWVRRGDVVRRPGEEDLAGTGPDGDFYQYLKLKQAFPSFRVLGREKLADRNVVVAGAAAQGGLKVTLYFDAASGLLVRRAAQIKTPLGALPDVVDFENYRKVNGIAFPFRTKRSRPPNILVQEFSEIRINVPIEDSKFTAPAQ